jgi:hypothetical protein
MYQHIFHCKALQDLPKLHFFGLKLNHLATPAQKLSGLSTLDKSPQPRPGNSVTGLGETSHV